MCALNRIRVGEFSILDAVDLEDLKAETINSHIIPIEKVFDNNPEISLSTKELQLFLNGVKLYNNQENGVYKVYSQNEFIGIGVINNNFLKRDIII